eukprot:Phypoly_transcript_09919.p1 GENE.Phypoly_transcript_09919~~Phypoly_transcript_09919.p1  ORF type:complete len:325 (+),score=75.94 Phypoly_transcript_09919:162-1136(+)
MYLSLFVILVLLSIVIATSPILVAECGTLNIPHSTYKLAHDIIVRNTTYGFVCFDITGDEIMLDGNGFELSSASNKMLHATGVRYSGRGTVVANLRVANMRTGIHAKGKFGEVFNNTITRAINGIDVSAANNRIQNNIVGQFEAYEATAGIYVYFPAIAPVDSFINITNNVISDIQGDSFALGISVYYATSVFIANNFIFNLRGGISSEEISVIHGKIDSVDNSFSPPLTPEGSYTQAITTLASLFALVASFVYYRSSSPSLPPPSERSKEIQKEEKEDEKEKEEKEKEKEREEKEKEEEYEMDGADVIKPTMSVQLGSSTSGW